jgi:hypothetical protein
VNGFNDYDLIEANKEDKLVICDINRHYTDCMYNPLDKWIVVDFNDEWEEHDGKLTRGLYMVETEDTTLLHKNNIYSNTILEFAIEEGIKFSIVAQLKTKNTFGKDLFQPIIDEIVRVCDGDKLSEKQMCNMVSGMLGKHMTTKHNLNLNSDYDQILNWFLRK